MVALAVAVVENPIVNLYSSTYVISPSIAFYLRISSDLRLLFSPLLVVLGGRPFHTRRKAPLPATLQVCVCDGQINPQIRGLLICLQLLLLHHLVGFPHFKESLLLQLLSQILMFLKREAWLTYITLIPVVTGVVIASELKWKVAIDVDCNPLGKSEGALIHQFMILTFGSLANSTPYL